MLPRPRILRSSTWRATGCCLPFLWFAILVLALTNGLTGPVTAWVEKHGPVYMFAYRHILDGVFIIFLAAILVCIPAGVLMHFEKRMQRRLQAGQCPHCGYPIGTSD